MQRSMSTRQRIPPRPTPISANCSASPGRKPAAPLGTRLARHQVVLMEYARLFRGSWAGDEQRHVYRLFGAGWGYRLEFGGRPPCRGTSQQWTTPSPAPRKGKPGAAHWIELQGIGPGRDTLRALPPGEQFDFAFIDADKTGYAQYYEEVLARLRAGGLILLDNTLQGAATSSAITQTTRTS